MGGNYEKDMYHQLIEVMARLDALESDLRKERIAQGLGAFPANEISAFEESYQELISKGRKQNRETKHCYAQKEEKALLNRMEKYRENHLLFLHEFAVPFYNNRSERDLRKAKKRQKMAGGFRKANGNEVYCSILSIKETLKRRDMALLENIKHLFNGNTGYFLACAKPICSAGGLNCYEHLGLSR